MEQLLAMSRVLVLPTNCCTSGPFVIAPLCLVATCHHFMPIVTFLTRTRIGGALWSQCHLRLDLTHLRVMDVALDR